MESKVSNNHTRNIYRPSMPEKEVKQKENMVGKIAERWQIWKSYAYTDTNIGKVLFHFVMFCDKWNRGLLSKIYHIP